MRVWVGLSRSGQPRRAAFFPVSRRRRANHEAAARPRNASAAPDGPGANRHPQPDASARLRRPLLAPPAPFEPVLLDPEPTLEALPVAGMPPSKVPLPDELDWEPGSEISPTHSPASHDCPGGHTAPSQSSTQEPPSQWVPGSQLTSLQAASMHIPRSALHRLPSPQPLHSQVVKHAPSMHTRLSPHATPAHGSTQRPARHSCPNGHTTPPQGSTQSPA
jgi:hypothetical protein